MDIKDYILIGGSLLITAVVAHGIWIAWRAKRDPLRLKIDDKLIAAVAEREPPQADFPNGGARVVGRWDDDLGERSMPVSEADPRLSATAARGGRAEVAAPLDSADRSEPAIGYPGPREAEVAEGAVREAAAQRDPGKLAPSGDAPRQGPGPERRGDIRVGEAAAKREAPRTGLVRRAQEAVKAVGSKAPARQPPNAGRSAASGSGASVGNAAQPAPPPDGQPEDLILINVLAPREQPFTGPNLVEALRANGLRYGDMNIFHRIDAETGNRQYSIANIIEPGTFDLAELEVFRTPGVCFFMQLPGPEQPVDAFEDMHRVARDVAERLGGELKDERRSVLTGQTVEHYRHRVAEFCRRRMSLRA